MIPTLPQETRIGAVELTVRDLKRELSFYEGVLGFRARPGGAPGDLGIVKLVEDPSARPRAPRESGLYHMAIVLPSRADLGRLISHLLAVRYPLQGASDHDVSEALYLADPEGNGIEIYSDRPADTWSRVGERVQMGVQPMDVEGVLESGGGEPWGGMPEGTRMGHVHLQVSDVASASRFYHDVLGFDITANMGGSAAFLSAGGYHHHVGVNAWGTQGGPPARPRETLGLRRFSVLLPDARAVHDVVGRLVQAGAPMEHEGGAIVTRDPSGNVVELTTA